MGEVARATSLRGGSRAYAARYRLWGAKNQVVFLYSAEKLAALSLSVSPGRLAPYLSASDNDPEAAFRLYELNAQFSAALYMPLQVLEVTIRNAMDRALCDRFGGEWIDLKDIILHRPQQDDVLKATSEVATNEKGEAVDYTRDDIIAELNFGFWVGLLGPKNDVEVWRKALWKAFPHRPKGIERAAVQGALNSVRRLRNRIAHHCRIIHRDLAADHKTILEAIGWVCPNTRDWASEISTFNPDDIPMPQETLPMRGIPEVDVVSPEPAESKVEPKPTYNGRRRLSLRQ